MKTIKFLTRFTAMPVLLVLMLNLASTISYGQSSSNIQSPASELGFSNPVLVSGTAGADNAVYRFNTINSNRDALLTITRRSSSLVKLEQIDATSEGYAQALQPQISFNNGNTTTASSWWIEFRIEFVDKNGNGSSSITDFNLTAIDMDGDNSKLQETAIFYGASSYKMSTNTSLALENITDSISGSAVSGRKFLGTRMNFPGIDTTRSSVMATVSYSDKDNIVFRLGANTAAASSNTKRTYSLYFKSFAYNTPAFLLPLMLYSFDATVNKNDVNLSWVTSWEKNLSHFEMETSINGKQFVPEAYIAGAGYAANKTSYTFKDNISEFGSGVIYYRLKIVSTDGNFGYSPIRIVRIGNLEEGGARISTYPNPVQNDLRITIPANWQGKAVRYEVYGVTGRAVKVFTNGSASQTEAIDMSNIERGFYFVRVSSGAETLQEKFIKN